MRKLKKKKLAQQVNWNFCKGRRPCLVGQVISSFFFFFLFPDPNILFEDSHGMSRISVIPWTLQCPTKLSKLQKREEKGGKRNSSQLKLSRSNSSSAFFFLCILILPLISFSLFFYIFTLPSFDK